MDDNREASVAAEPGGAFVDELVQSSLDLAVTRPDLAQEQAERALALNPGNGLALAALANALVAQGQSDLASQTAREAVGLAPDEFLPYVVLADIDYRIGRLREAYATALTIIAGWPSVDFGYGMLALVHIEQGRFGDAIAAARNGLAVNPRSGWCRELLAMAHSFRGEHADAIATIREAVAADPVGAEALTRMGQITAATGDHTSARSHYRAALAVAPDFAPAWKEFESMRDGQEPPLFDAVGMRIFWRFAPAWERGAVLVIVAASALLWVPAWPACAWSFVSFLAERRRSRFNGHLVFIDEAAKVVAGMAGTIFVVIGTWPIGLALAVIGLSYWLLLATLAGVRRPLVRRVGLAGALGIAAAAAVGGLLWPELRGHPFAAIGLLAVIVGAWSIPIGLSESVAESGQKAGASDRS